MTQLPSLATAQDVRNVIRVAARARRIALRLTQVDLSARSGVPLATVKRFEQQGAVGLDTLLAIAVVLDALEGFLTLFPPVEVTTLDGLERSQRPRQRVRSRAGRTP